ncbi:hypothetical protein PENARI_c021G00237 [Penicillium arizonense]|uniref:Mitochondrial division protein 1 n=1 Tax=Penicillium arizonense TaxID=1835702 RepID=A0A1F5L8A4_PENAI|nr:hypothetical protein PENARI_c021G00237 [Penicillium arizonense]OGE49412.1 hypothetical protein PENARI_c021G00237 [Penicillium arizonense]
MSNDRLASLLKRAFKRDSAEIKEPGNNAAVGPPTIGLDCVTRTSSVVAIADQATESLSASNFNALEKAPRTKTDEFKPPAARVRVQETPATVTLPQRQATDTRDTQPIFESLWDEAYDTLKQERPDLMSRYEDLLSRVLVRVEANALSAPSQQEDIEDIGNQIPQQDVAARREKLKRIAELGLQHMEDKKAKVTILGHEVSLQDRVGQLGEAVAWAQEYVKDAIKDVPYAPAVMAGISLILPLFKNPATVDAANRAGFTYVTSQMRYYVELETVILPADMKHGLKAYLTEGIVDLYKLIIDFQVQSVIRFYRSGTKNYFRSVINYDKWQDRLDHLMAEERKLKEKFESALSGSNMQQLKKLAGEAEESRKIMNRISDNIQGIVGFLERTEQRTSNDEHRRCLASLQINDPSFDPSLDKARIENVKGGLLRDSYRWVLDHVDFRRWRDERYGQLLWIKGDPGKGKTMLLCGIIDELSKVATHDINISFFFCQATNSRINSATAVLRGLIYMLVQQQSSLAAHVRVGSFEGENAWVALLKVFTNILGDPQLRKTYLIIDALDECATDLDQLLDLLAHKTSARSNVKWIVSSRNWPDIEKGLRGATPIELRLESNENTLAAAIDSYIQFKVNELSEKNEYKLKTREDVHDHLKTNANGTFLWVALVCKRLAKVANRNVRGKLKDFPPGLDELYKRMLSQISESDDADLCKSLLSVTTTVYRPITLDELASCFDDLPEDVVGDYKALEEIVGHCGSFLTLRQGTISLVHQSAKDFLIQEAAHIIFPGGVERTLEGHSNAVNFVAFSHDSKLLASASWDQTVKVWDSSSGQCLQTLEGHCTGVNSVTFSHDSKLLASASWDKTVKVWDASSGQCLQTLEGHSEPVYSVVFSHDSKLLASASEDNTVKVWNSSNGQCLQTLEGHSEPVNFIAFSHDSKLLASASEDSTARMWDASSGQCLQTLEGHHTGVRSVTFSHDSELLASASWDKTVKMWDASSGQCLQTLGGHSEKVSSVVFSHDSKLLTSASWDNTVKMWDASSGQCLQTLDGHSAGVRSVIFSHDSKLLAFASDDKTVKVWDTCSGHCLQTVLVNRWVKINSFDDRAGCFELDIGTIRFRPGSSETLTTTDPQLPLFQGLGISPDGTWITWNSGNLLWLPPDYRPYTSAVSLSKLSLGCRSGRVSIFDFDSDKLSHLFAGL